MTTYTLTAEQLHNLTALIYDSVSTNPKWIADREYVAQMLRSLQPNTLGQMCDGLRRQLEAPDCRTCRHVHWSQFKEGYRCHFAEQGGVCINGNQYIGIPKLVLWRTE